MAIRSNAFKKATRLTSGYLNATRGYAEPNSQPFKKDPTNSEEGGLAKQTNHPAELRARREQGLANTANLMRLKRQEPGYI